MGYGSNSYNELSRLKSVVFCSRVMMIEKPLLVNRERFYTFVIEIAMHSNK